MRELGKTGKVFYTPVTMNGFIIHTTTVHKCDDGVWWETYFIWRRF